MPLVTTLFKKVRKINFLPFLFSAPSAASFFFGGGGYVPSSVLFTQAIGVTFRYGKNCLLSLELNDQRWAMDMAEGFALYFQMFRCFEKLLHARSNMTLRTK
jgi:hypothetical protein